MCDLRNRQLVSFTGCESLPFTHLLVNILQHFTNRSRHRLPARAQPAGNKTHRIHRVHDSFTQIGPARHTPPKHKRMSVLVSQQMCSVWGRRSASSYRFWKCVASTNELSCPHMCSMQEGRFGSLDMAWDRFADGPVKDTQNHKPQIFDILLRSQFLRVDHVKSSRKTRIRLARRQSRDMQNGRWLP